MYIIILIRPPPPAQEQPEMMLDMHISIKYGAISNIKSDTAQFKLNINEVRVVVVVVGAHSK